MSADLMVMVFEGEAGAKNAQNALRSLRAGLTFGLGAAILVSYSTDGKISFEPAEVPPDEVDETTEQLTNLFAHTLFSQSTENEIHPLVEAGMDRDLLNEVGDVLVPDSSALLVFLTRAARSTGFACSTS